jgi:hypothetical protein
MISDAPIAKVGWRFHDQMLMNSWDTQAIVEKFVVARSNSKLTLIAVISPEIRAQPFHFSEWRDSENRSIPPGSSAFACFPSSTMTKHWIFGRGFKRPADNQPSKQQCASNYRHSIFSVHSRATESASLRIFIPISLLRQSNLIIIFWLNRDFHRRGSFPYISTEVGNASEQVRIQTPSSTNLVPHSLSFIPNSKRWLDRYIQCPTGFLTKRWSQR